MPHYSASIPIPAWVHITCVNYNKEIYFTEQWIKIRDYEGSMGSPET